MRLSGTDHSYETRRRPHTRVRKTEDGGYKEDEEVSLQLHRRSNNSLSETGGGGKRHPSIRSHTKLQEGGLTPFLALQEHIEIPAGMIEDHELAVN